MASKPGTDDTVNDGAATLAATEATTAIDSYILAEDDVSLVSENTFSVVDGIAVYGKPNKSFFPRWNSAWSGKIVTSRLFKRAVISLIMIYSVIVAVSTTNFARDRPHFMSMMEIIDLTFLSLFSAELGLQFIYLGPKFFVDGWCVFDFIVILSSWFVHPLLTLRTFRIVRTLRLATRVKDLPFLIKALLATVPKMLSVCFLLIIEFYTFSIVFTDLFQDLYKNGDTSEDYFSSLATTSLTLFQIMTLDGWGNITKEVMQVYPWAWIPFLLFIMTSSFFFLNLIIAVICEAVSKVQQERQILKLGRQMGLREINTQDSSPASVYASKTDQDISRLERKIDKLTASVEMLVKMQSHGNVQL